MNGTHQENAVTFKHNGGGKWEFYVSEISFRYYSKSPDGFTGAQKIARIIGGAIKRTGGMDGMARKMIFRMFEPKRPLETIVY